MLDAADDRRLVRRFLRSRSERSFLALYRRHTAALYQTALRLTGGHDAEAEDVIQETWIRAARQLGAFAWRSSLRTWLTGFVVNVYRERSRRSSREEPLVELRLLDGGRDSDAGLDLERAIADLAPRYREVLVLYDIEGYTHGEIGRLLGIDAGTSKSQLSRARRALRERLGGSGGTPDARRHG